MSAPTPDLDDRLPHSLRRLADGVTAPPTSRTLDAVHQRAGAIRRRRHTHAALAGTCAVLAAAAVIGGVWLRGGDADLRTGPVDAPPSPSDTVPLPDPDRLPAFTIDDDLVVPRSLIDETTATRPRIEIDFGYGDRGSVHVTVERVATESEAQAAFMKSVMHRGQQAATVEEVVVLGRPAQLFNADGPEPELMWRHTTVDLVDVHLPGTDRRELDRLIAGITEMDATAWEQLKESLAGGDG